jgi:hypothetical protein
MHDVGQVLYVVLTKKQKVVPVRVTEQIVRRSISGESIQYLVQVPGRSELIDLNSLGKEIYSTLEEVRERLQENIRKAVEEMIDKAASIAHAAFGSEDISSHDLNSEIPQNGSSNLQVVLENGQVANVNIDDSILRKVDQ